MPAIKKNLLSIYRLTNNNYVYVEFHANHCIIKEEGTRRPLLKGTVRDRLYLLTSDNKSPVAYAAEKVAMDQWHQRLGHPHFKVLHSIISTYGLPALAYNKISPCDACLSSKSHKLSYSIPQHSTCRPLELIHSDLWGPSPVLSHLGHKYYVIFIDDFTRYTWLYPLKLKSDVLNIFTNFHQKVERQFNLKLLNLQSDWGGEFQAISKYVTSCGIHHRLCCPHTPAQNGTAERKHRHIIETALSLVKQASMPHKFWDEAACTAAYLINRMPTPLLKFKSTYQLLFNQDPDYSFLRTFGCMCYPYLRPYAATKLDSQSECCTFLGYSAFHRGYCCISMTSGRLYISRNVIFSETVYPFAAKSTHLPQSVQSILGSSPHDGSRQLLTTEPLKSTQTSTNIPTSPAFNTKPSLASPLIMHSDTLDSPSSPHHDSSLNSPSRHIPSSNPLSPSNLDHQTSPSHIQTKSISVIIQSLDNLPSTHFVRYPLPKCYSITSNPILEPMTYHSASKHSHWVQAMQEEFIALRRNQTWSLVPCPSNRPVIGCRWIYKTKFSPNGQVDRFKARLVAKGYHQEGGIDYHETFSPVIKVTTIRLLLSLAISKNWQIRQLDISNAFLHGDLKELIYMEQPQGFHDIAFPHHVCRLHKSLDGLKQAPREWYQKLSGQLLRLDFTGSKSDTSLFFLNSSPIYVLIYVDDILILKPSSTQISALVKSLSELFTLRDLGTASHFLGVEFRPCPTAYFLTQGHYIASILQRMNTGTMSQCKPVATPSPVGTPNSKTETYDDPSTYRSIVGALQYLNMTRLDIVFAVNQACRSMHSPQPTGWMRLEHLLRY